MKFKIILVSGMAMSLAVSANAQLLNASAGIQTGGESGGGRTPGAQVVAISGTVISVADRAMRDTTLQSRAAKGVAGQPARAIADASDGVVVAGGINGIAKVSSDAGLPSAAPSKVIAERSFSGSETAPDAR